MFLPELAHAQEQGKVWFDGAARSFFARDAVGDTEFPDTTSSINSSSGYNVLDVNTHINPNENIEVFAQLRVRNTFGGFFGSGTSVDVRQLTAKGTINDKVRFSIGDLYLKQTRFTLFNNDEELSSQNHGMFQSYRDIIHYENFYTENRWRQQGLQTNFSFNFDRFIRTLAFDFFITRPRGSELITSSTNSSDMLLSGGSMVTQINKRFNVQTHYVNLFEVGSSGTSNISVRNPVYQLSLTHMLSLDRSKVTQTIQTGFSQRHWLYSELPSGIEDSISNVTKGLFFQFENEYFQNDSTFRFTVGYRYVDPAFRSAGAQTRRLDFGQESLNSTYPLYTNASLRRPTSLFDIISDENIYNQDLSTTLMEFNPIYSNISPYGDATPNRQGAYLSADLQTSSKSLITNVKSGYFTEVIGQGTPERRTFFSLQSGLKFNVHQRVGWRKILSVSLSSDYENTQRSGDEYATLQLRSQQSNVFVNAEVTEDLFVQFGWKQFKTEGREYVSERNEYGEIVNFNLRDFDQKDHLVSTGILYQLRQNVYANLQYNWWGVATDDPAISDFNYTRLMFVLSIKL